MRKIFLFMNVSLDGYFEAPGHDISWATHDYEAFSPDESGEVDALLFGRRTYEMMESFWPTPQAAEFAPEVARFMNEKQKLVASHTAFEPGWSNVRVIHGDVPGEVRRIKAGPGKTIAMFGSNTLCVSLMQAGLVDEFQIQVNPVALGAGTPLFTGLSSKVALTLTGTQKFNSGAVLLSYAPTPPPAPTRHP